MILFHSADLLVRQVGAVAPGAPVVVTFDCYGDWHGRPDRPGFGEAFLAGEGIAAIHVLPSGNHWYQYPDMLPTLEAIRAALAGAGRVITYGSSMGGYAAVRFADWVGAGAALALSPQYSIDPAKAAFDRRWPQEGRAIGWRAELDGPIRSAIEPILVYDDRGPDRRHARLIERDTPATHIRLPHAAHPVGTTLLETGLLRPLVLGVVHGTLDRQSFERQARRLLPQSATYWTERARQLPWWRAGTAVRFAAKAAELAPHNPLALHVLAASLDRAGRSAEALPLHEQVARLTDRAPGYLRPHSFSLAAAGDLPGALALAEEITTAQPDVARNHQWQAWLLGLLGRRDEALAAVAHAQAIDPGNRALPRLAEAIAAGRNLRRYRPHRRTRG